MAVKLNEKFLEGFVSAHEMENIRPAAESAYRVLKDRNGPGNDFLGWMDLPVNYDKEEFARIKVAAKRSKAPVIFWWFWGSVAPISAPVRQLNL